MAEKLAIDLELVDRVSGKAKVVANELRKVEEQAKRTQDRALAKFGDAFSKIGMRASMDQWKGEQKAAVAREKALKSAERAAEKASIKQEKSDARAAKLAETAAAKAEKARASAAAKAEAKAAKSALKAQKDKEKRDKEFQDSYREFKENAVSSAKTFGLVAGAAVIAAAYKAASVYTSTVKDAVKEGSAYEQLKLAYKLTLGEKGSKEALADITRFSSQSGYDDDEIAKTMLPLFRAGLRGQGARSAYAAAEDLSAMAPGSKPEDFAEFLAKIKLKGGISEKMLLGLGLGSEDFKAELAKTLHTDKKTAMERAESGKADPQAILNALYTQIEKRTGGKLGSGGDAFAKTMGAQLHKLEQLPSNYLKTIADSDAWPRMTDRVAQLLDSLDPDGPRGRAIIGALTDAFTKLTDLADRALTPENIQGFVDTVVTVVETLGKIPQIFTAIADKVDKVTNAVSPLVDKIGTALGVSRNGDYTDFFGNKVSFKDVAETVEQPLPRVPMEGEGQGPGVGYGSVLADMREPKRGRRGGAPIVVNNTNHVTVHPAKDDVEHTGHKVAQVVSRSTSRGLERGAQEGGGG